MWKNKYVIKNVICSNWIWLWATNLFLLIQWKDMNFMLHVFHFQLKIRLRNCTWTPCMIWKPSCLAPLGRLVVFVNISERNTHNFSAVSFKYILLSFSRNYMLQWNHIKWGRWFKHLSSMEEVNKTIKSTLTGKSVCYLQWQGFLVCIHNPLSLLSPR